MPAPAANRLAPTFHFCPVSGIDFSGVVANSAPFFEEGQQENTQPQTKQTERNVENKGPPPPHGPEDLHEAPRE